MNKFVAKKTRLLVLASWFFAGMLFCDAANLDDLLPGAVVLHDDADVVVANSGTHATQELLPALDGITLHARSSVARQLPHAAPQLRLIMDQDSPSLAADGLIYVDKELLSLVDRPGSAVHPILPAEQLYLKLHILLI